MADYPAIHGVKGSFNYKAYLPYYPVRYQVSDELQKVRQFIYDFKDGRNPQIVAQKLADTISNSFSENEPRNNWWLCIIPASKVWKTSVRFEEFCKEFSQLTGVNNGYSLITATGDRPEMKTAEDKKAINIIDYMGFGDVRGKRVLLFDDVYTTGTSFLKVATKLQELGVSEIKGLFLGKTHWQDETDDFLEDLEEEIDGVPDLSQDFDDFDDSDYSPGRQESYGQYSGTWAQDVEGLSDDFINDVLDGEPDAYWNID